MMSKLLSWMAGKKLKDPLTALPTMGAKGVRASQQAFTAVLSYARFHAYLQMKELTNARTADQKRLVANYINVASGAANWGGMPGVQQAMGVAFWSPNLLVSRLQWIIGQPLWHGVGKMEDVEQVRKQIVVEYIRAMMGAAAETGVKFGFLGMLAYLASTDDKEDKKVELGLDWRSSDFMKLRKGRTRYDTMGGLAQVGTWMGRIATTEIKSTTTGRVNYISPYDATKLFLQYKGAPYISLTASLYSSRDWRGRPASRWDIIAEQVPMAPYDIYKNAKENGIPEALLTGVWAMTSDGINIYEERKKRDAKKNRYEWH